MRTLMIVTVGFLAGCGIPNDTPLYEEPLDDEFAVDQQGLLVYPSTGEFEEEPRGTLHIPDDLLEPEPLPADDLPFAEDVFLEEGVTDPTLAVDLPAEEADGDLAEASQGLVTCNKRRATGYRNGKAFAVTLVNADYKPHGRNAANAFYYMERAAARAGVSLVVNSGFRTMAQQRYLYNCYLTKKCNNGNLAARPGYSNHQGGIALDISTRNPRVFTWLKNNARRYGYVRTVPSEPWHWEYRGAARTSPCKP